MKTKFGDKVLMFLLVLLLFVSNTISNANIIDL